MKCVGLDGKRYSINLAEYQTNTNVSGKSKYHLLARELIRETLPSNPVYEEVLLPGCRTKLYADFFLPTQHLIVEVHGEQHYEDNSFFYSTPLDFAKAKLRDNDKRAWCEANSILYVELPYKESLDEWRKRLR